MSELHKAIIMAMKLLKEKSRELDRQYFELSDEMNGVLIEQMGLEKAIGILKLELNNAGDTKTEGK